MTFLNCGAGEFDFSEIQDKIVFCYNSFTADLMIAVFDHLSTLTHKPGETISYLGGMPSAVRGKINRLPIIDKSKFLTQFDMYEQYSVFRLQ